MNYPGSVAPFRVLRQKWRARIKTKVDFSPALLFIGSVYDTIGSAWVFWVLINRTDFLIPCYGR